MPLDLWLHQYQQGTNGYCYRRFRLAWTI